MKLILITLLLTLSVVVQAEEFKVGDYIKFETYLGGKFNSTVEKEILENDGTKVLIKRFEITEENQYMTYRYHTIEKLNSETTTESECLEEKGVKGKMMITALSKEINICTINLYRYGTIVVSDDIPFYYINSSLHEYHGKVFTNKILDFRFGN